MWSVWSERVDVYLGTGLVLVQRHRAPLWTLEPPATLPLADVLQQADLALDRANARPWRLHVHLSATLCPPLAFGVPAGVRQHAEVLAIAQASAAKAWALPAEQAAEIVCNLDAHHIGLAAAMLAGTHRLISQWAMRHKGQLASLRPLWADATAASACTGQQVTGLAVLEPDALTALNLGQTAAPHAKSWSGRFQASDAISLLAETGDPVKQANPATHLAVAFNRGATQKAWAQGPSVWAKHWSVLP